MYTFILMFVIAAGVALWAHIMIRHFPDTTEVTKIKTGLWEKYTKVDFPSAVMEAKDQKVEAERVITYTERVIDRQINKARGILPFNSIVIAVFGFEKTNLQPSHDVIFNLHIPWLLLFAMLGLAISSVLCLKLFFVRWAKSDNYKYFHHELENTLDVILRRSKTIELATIFSLSALLVGAAAIVLIELVPKT